ncbi:MAG TPA: hypothetical protein VK957_13750 [Lunatimonas sp.]|nr:hypothetical protein [Lunatimonas sp.]
MFETFDDDIPLVATITPPPTPEMGWIENGVIEKSHDLDAENTTGYFLRILGGAQKGCRPGMEVKQSDALV